MNILRWKALIATLTAAWLLAGCSGNLPIAMHAHGHDNHWNHSPAENASDGAVLPLVTAPKAFSLTWLPVDPPPSLGQTIALSDVFVRMKLEHNLVVYANNADETEWFVGYANGNKEIAAIGSVYEEQYLPELSVSDIRAFGEDMIVIQGHCGAACAFNYLLKRQDGELELKLELFGGLQFADLDRDGIDELLVYVGNPVSEIELYRLNNNQMVKVNVNQAIGAPSGVRYDAENNVFETMLNGQPARYQYSAKGDELQLIPESAEGLDLSQVDAMEVPT